MFGGHGLYSAEAFFGIVYDDGLYFKTDAVSAAGYVEKGMRSFQPNERQRLRNYYEVPPDVVDDREQLVLWAEAALKAGG